MKKENEEGKELLRGIKSNRLSDIRDQVIYGSGSTLKEKLKKREEEHKKRLDE